jgi:hypothetical protein
MFLPSVMLAYQELFLLIGRAAIGQWWGRVFPALQISM